MAVAQSALGCSSFVVALERKASEQVLGSDNGSGDYACSLSSGMSRQSSGMSRQSSGETGCFLQTGSAASRRDARAINGRLMAAQSPQEIFSIVVEHLPELDSINITAALQRLAKFLSGDDHSQLYNTGGSNGSNGSSRNHGLKEAVLSSPVFQALAGMMVEQCNSGCFNAQSTANAWWAVAKLHAAEHPASVEMVGALENALIACLTAPTDSVKPNAQGVSSIWYSCGRLASDGYAPSPVAVQLMWHRTQKLALSFDSQGLANILWAFGQLRKKHGEAFPVRADVLASLQFVVARIAPSFAVQGLSCAAVGCANMGPALRSAVLPLVHILVAESMRRPWQFNLQAMSNMATAISRLGKELTDAEPTQALLAAFDAHAATLPPTLKSQEAAALCNALKSCGVVPNRFRPVARLGAPAQLQAQLPPPAPAFAAQDQRQQQQQFGSLCDATNSGSWAAAGAGASTSGTGAGSSGWAPAAAATCVPANQLAVLPSLAGLLAPPPPPPRPGQPPVYHQQHHQYQNQYRQHQYQQQLYQQQQQQQAQWAHASLSGSPHMLAIPLPLAAGGPLSISQYAALAQQLAAADRAPSPHQLPLPMLVAPFPARPATAEETGCQAAPGGPFAASSGQAAAAAHQSARDAHHAHLQRILAVLQSLKVQDSAS